MTDHAHWADAAGAYLLGALADDERRGYEAHLEDCPECREDVAFLRVATDALPTSVEQFAAPAALKDRIMTVVNSEAELLRAAGPEADRPPVRAARRERRWWSFVPRSGLALAASVLLIVGGVTGYLLSDGGDAPVPTKTIRAEVTVPGSPGARADLVVRGDRSTLRTSQLPSPGAGRVYQVWLMRDGARAPEPTDALFKVSRDGSASVIVPGSLKDVAAVLVTEEPEGGSPAPTSDPIIAATPA